MIGKDKQALYKFLTNNNQGRTSKQLSANTKLNFMVNKSAKTSPNSYNNRNLKKNGLKNEENNFIINKDSIYFSRQSKTTNKTCYNNINLLDNLKEKDEVNTSKMNSIIKETIKCNKSKEIPKNPKYDKGIFNQIMKYYTMKSKNEPVKFEDFDKFFEPIRKLLKCNNTKDKKDEESSKNNINNTGRKNIKIKNVNISLVNINNIESKIPDRNSKGHISKISDSLFSSIIQEKNQNQNQIVSTPKNTSNFCIRGSINDNNKNYIGVDENFNLTFGKSNNKIEMMTSSTNTNSNNINSINSVGNYMSTNTFTNTYSNSNINNSISNKNSDNIINYINSVTENYRNSRTISIEKTFKNEVRLREKTFGNINGKKNYNNNEKGGIIFDTPTFVNNNSNTIDHCRDEADRKEGEDDDINRSRTSYQFRPRRMNLPKNGINLASLKLNNQIMQSILNKNHNNFSQKRINNFKVKS